MFGAISMLHRLGIKHWVILTCDDLLSVPSKLLSIHYASTQ